MEIDALPLERGAVVERAQLPTRRTSASGLRSIHASSAQSLSPRSSFHRLHTQDDDLERGDGDERSPRTAGEASTPLTSLRRVQSYQVTSQRELLESGSWAASKRKSKAKRHSHLGDAQSSDEVVAILRAESLRFKQQQQRDLHDDEDDGRGGITAARVQAQVLEVLVNLTSGVIAFLLSSTLAVSCASVIVGHGTPLSLYIAHFIDMNFLGTAVLSVVLAWQSCAPWTLGAIDVFVVPVMATIAGKITMHLQDDMDSAVATSIVMVALVSVVLGVVFYFMGILRVTSAANYMPYPVIAGFLSGIGAELIKNGVHMAAENAFSLAFFTLEQQLLILPAVLFAVVARIGQHLRWPVAISFPCLLILSLVGFHVTTRAVLGFSFQELEDLGWIFPWPKDVVEATPMWYPWTQIDFGRVHWRLLTHECFGYLVSLVILGALKYSVATTSLSTLFGREISADNEMRVIGLANIAAGVFGGCGGCHYLSAMGIMKQFDAHEKVPALVCAALLVLLWMQGIRLLQFVPKFVFGGLILSVGVHFLEAYFVAPFQFLKPVEQGIVVVITASFLVVGMLEAVGLGVIISMLELIFRIYEVGCVHHETTGQLSRSAVDRTRDQVAFLDANGAAIFVLRLQGYLFFGTSVNIVERIQTRVQSLECPKIEFVVVDMGLVPSFDATALLNFRKATVLAERYGFEIYYCGLKHSIELALRRNETAAHTAPPATSRRVHYLSADVDVALEQCENRLLPKELCRPVSGSADDWKGMNQLTLWEHFIAFHDDLDALLVDTDTASNNKKLIVLASFLERQVVPKGARLTTPHSVKSATYFICYGYMDVLVEAEFMRDHLPGIVTDGPSGDQSLTAGGSTGSRRKSSISLLSESQWAPLSTARSSRLRKIGPGSIVTADMLLSNDAGAGSGSQYIATSDCVLLRLSADAMERVEHQAPHTAVAILRLINSEVATRFLSANKRVTQLSSLLYK
ncbi:hypothetical protein P43SY_003479 [Pythium insidiosum]|uniref:STAS domain-containing protein n=1 Tax=Pythium insidiosum TaxID=114742 RepID=A0AAD5M571_PYTIN|nr:hypothetical protein P43SY_003479 [Pythium insidiosum]